MKWALRHRTFYHYGTPVHDSFNEARLKPAQNRHQRLDSFELTIRPEARLGHQYDFYGNWVDHFEVIGAHSFLEVESRAVVETLPPPPLPEDALLAPMEMLEDAARETQCFDFLQASRFTDLEPATWRTALDAAAGQSDVWQTALALMRFVNQRLEYDSNATHVHTPMREALARGRGVCQDFAHVMIGLSRSLRIPTRYVSGYLATQDASATHAWTEVYIPSVGWRGLDPTHNRQPGEDHVKIAIGRDYNDVAPVRGAYRGTLLRRLQVEVQIQPA